MARTWDRVSIAALLAGAIGSLTFAHVGSHFYSNGAARLLWLSLPPLVLFLIAALLARFSARAQMLVAITTWISVIFCNYAYTVTFYFSPPDGQKVMVFAFVSAAHSAIGSLLVAGIAAVRISNRWKRIDVRPS